MIKRWQKITFVSLVGMLGVVGTAAAAKADSLVYAITLDGKQLGSAEIQTETVTWNSRTMTRLSSVTTLKVALLGATKTIQRRSTTLVESGTGIPVRCDISQDINDNVTHIECRFEESQVQIRKWDDGDSKPEPTTIKLDAPVCVLGNNDFAHWTTILRAAAARATDGRAEVPVFLADASAVQKLGLQRGESKNVTIAGKSHQSIEWQLAGSDISFLVDAATGTLLQMDVPAQKTRITLSDKANVTAAAKDGPPEVLAQHFVQSNVTFDDFLAVRELQAKLVVTVIGEAVENDTTVLTTSMQSFDGRKQQAHVTGTVTIQSRKYVPTKPVAFSTSGAENPTGPWLAPSVMIESDAPEIVAQAKRLTATMVDRWQAVQAIARWVHKNIRYTIADSPSAKMALEKRVGDCGPHATLAVAMMRAVGIPAKLVGGLVYAPMFGGSFGQHAWVEVDMGDDGWIALDPTTGELDSLSAVHIKLFEGMGGVVPKSIDVVHFAPQNQPSETTVPSASQPLAWQLNREYTYVYLQNGKELGKQRFQFKKRSAENTAGYVMTSSLDLTVGAVHVVSDTRLESEANAMPVRFVRNMEAKSSKVTRDCKFADGKVLVQLTGAANLQRNVTLKPGTYCFDNNLIPSFALICSQLDYQVGKDVRIATFHPTSMSIIPLTFKTKSLQRIQVAGQELECYQCEVAPLNNTFWISRDRRLVKVDAPGIAIELARDEVRGER